MGRTGGGGRWVSDGGGAEATRGNQEPVRRRCWPDLAMRAFQPTSRVAKGRRASRGTEDSRRKCYGALSHGHTVIGGKSPEQGTEDFCPARGGRLSSLSARPLRCRPPGLAAGGVL